MLGGLSFAMPVLKQFSFVVKSNWVAFFEYDAEGLTFLILSEEVPRALPDVWIIPFFFWLVLNRALSFD